MNASLVSGLYYPSAVALSRPDLFVANANNTIGEYTTSGVVVNASLVSGLDDPEAIAVTQPIPEPSTFALFGTALLGSVLAYLRRRRAKG